MSNARVFTAEAIGTAILVGAITGTTALTNLGPVGVALVGGLALVAAYATIGSTSGAHLNPAVSAGMAMAKRIDLPAMAIYWAGQVVGALVGAITVLAIARGRSGGFDADVSNFAANLSGHDVGMYSFAAVAVAEVVMSAALVMAYLLVRSGNMSAAAGAIPIGSAFAITQLLTANVDGGGVNPAKSLATALMARGDSIGSLWIFLLFPILGSVLGVMAWVAVDEATIEDTFLDELGLDEALEAIEDAIDKVTD